MKERIDWDTLWMTMAFSISQRSLDDSTKHGCVMVDGDNKIISVGYNSFPKNCIDERLPLTRPLKYRAILHSETNSIINANRSLKGATAYITGFPCPNCFGNMLNAGIENIVYGCVGSHCINEEDTELINLMNISKEGNKKITIKKYENIEDLQIFLNTISGYITEKLNRTDLING